jgi:hypothetical protein
MNWILSLAILGATLGGILTCLYLFVSLKRETAARRARCEARMARIEEALAALSERFEGQSAEWRDAAERANIFVAPAAPPSGLNLTRRSHALKMHRLGGAPEQIAKALGIPRNEVDLLLKVQKIVVANV